MSFKELQLEDAKNALLNTDEFAEEIKYASYGKWPVTIKAVIVRERLDPGSENMGRSLRNEAEVYILNDETEGIVSIDKKRDRITLQESNEEVTARISEVLGKDDALWRLLVSW